MTAITRSGTEAAQQKRRLKTIINRLEKLHPDAKLALDYNNPLELLIALILAAQARDDLVNQVTAGLFKTHRTAQDYAEIPLPKLEAQIKKINFYRNKAKSIHNCCKEIAARFGFRSPNAVTGHLAALARKGAIELAPGETRTLELKVRCDRWGAFRLGPLLLRGRDVLCFHSWWLAAGRRQPPRGYPASPTGLEPSGD